MHDTPAGRYRVRDAALRLGISEAAVRQRIRRNTLVAERSGGTLYVLLPDSTPDATPSHTVSDTPDATPDSPAIIAAQAQLAAIRDEWLAPLVDRIGELEREAGRLSAELEHANQARLAAEIERDELRGRQRLQNAVQETQVHAVVETAQEPPQRAWWAFWRRSGR